MSGEREFSIEEIARKHGLKYHTVYRAVKGRPGYRVYGQKRGAKVSESLYRSFLAEAIRKRVRCIGQGGNLSCHRIAEGFGCFHLFRDAELCIMLADDFFRVSDV